MFAKLNRPEGILREGGILAGAQVKSSSCVLVIIRMIGKIANIFILDYVPCSLNV